MTLKQKKILLISASAVFAGLFICQAGYGAIAKDLVYAKVDGRELKLDVYRDETAEHSMPLIVCVHGGAWEGGSKDWCPAARMVKSGYVVASINYRLSQHAPFPAQIHDCKGAIRWLRAHAGDYHIDPKRVGVWGASAGGHLVALLGTTEGNKELEGTVGGNLEHSSRVQAVCDFFGPTDLFGFYKDKKNRHYDYTTRVVDKLLGGPIAEKKDPAESANPVNHISADDSPFLIMHGDKDDLVPMKHSEILNEALKKAGVQTRLHVVKGAGHGFGGLEINKMVDEFFDRHLKARIRLIVRGDDIGSCHSANVACIKCYQEGIVRTVELMVPCPWFKEAVKILNENPGLDVGVHLTLTSEWENYKWGPLTKAPSLVDADGYFYPMTRQRGNFPANTGFLEGNPKLQEVEKELRAQIELAIKHVDNISHLSCHMGTATATPELKALVKKLSGEYKLPLGTPGVKYMGSFAGGASVDEKVDAMVNILENLDAGTWIYVEHPGLDTPEMKNIGHIGYWNVGTDREAVTRVFTSEKVKAVIKKRGIELISYADFYKHLKNQLQER
ncbi:MAG: ChbG/HpnK family deacetylase [Sedimentisphaerales bacterium]